jgi:two-component system, NarL family, response regulator DesR
VVTTFGRSGYLRRAMESGAVGFLLKDAPAAELVVAIRRVCAGERVVDPDLALAALSEGNNPLIGRERDVLAASLNGASIADIAARLSLSEGTVRNHLSIGIQKLGAHNRMEASCSATTRSSICPRAKSSAPNTLTPRAFASALTGKTLLEHCQS